MLPMVARPPVCVASSVDLSVAPVTCGRSPDVALAEPYGPERRTVCSPDMGGVEVQRITLQPEPPLLEMARPTGLGVGDLDNFTPLADPHLLTAAIAKIKDVNALNEVPL